MQAFPVGEMQSLSPHPGIASPSAGAYGAPMNSLLPLLLLAAACARAGTISYSTEIPYPTRYEVHRSVRDPRLVVAAPVEFSTRRVGVTLDAPAVGVVQRITVHASQPDTVDLRFDDGSVTTVRAGGNAVVGGRSYMVLGWRGADYLLHDPARRQNLRFTRK
jgi:hypothetical protein